MCDYCDGDSQEEVDPWKGHGARTPQLFARTQLEAIYWILFLWAIARKEREKKFFLGLLRGLRLLPEKESWFVNFFSFSSDATEKTEKMDNCYIIVDVERTSKVVKV